MHTVVVEVILLLREGSGMRVGLGVLFVLSYVAGAPGQDDKDSPAKRYEIGADLKTYPQAGPKETLASVLKAIEAKRADYLLAHLADPEWVDRRVQRYGGKFGMLVEESTAKLVADPGPAKRLRQFQKDGEWEIGDTSASVRLKEAEDQAVFFRKQDGRWFIENRKK
jgi:hypothetical protein